MMQLQNGLHFCEILFQTPGVRSVLLTGHKAAAMQRDAHGCLCDCPSFSLVFLDLLSNLNLSCREKKANRAEMENQVPLENR